MASTKEERRQADLALKQSILTAIDYLKELFRKWWLYIIFGVLAWFAAQWYIGRQISTYTAILTFMTNEDSDGGVSPLMKIATQFGVSGASGKVNADKIVELIRSRMIIINTLLDEHEGELLINHFQKAYNVNEWYEEYPDFQNYSFRTNSIDSFNLIENKISQDIYKVITREHMLANASENGIITVKYTSEKEQFSQVFLDRLMDRINEFYVTRTNEKDRETYEIVKRYTDSLSYQLNAAETNLANWKDKNLRTIKNKGLLTELQLLRKIETLNTAYSEALKNHELAKFNLVSNTPILQVIDMPVLPLKKNNPNILMIYLAFILAAFFVATILIIFWKIIRDALRVE